MATQPHQAPLTALGGASRAGPGRPPGQPAGPVARVARAGERGGLSWGPPGSMPLEGGLLGSVDPSRWSQAPATAQTGGVPGLPFPTPLTTLPGLTCPSPGGICVANGASEPGLGAQAAVGCGGRAPPAAAPAALSPRRPPGPALSSVTRRPAALPPAQPSRDTQAGTVRRAGPDNRAPFVAGVWGRHWRPGGRGGDAEAGPGEGGRAVWVRGGQRPAPALVGGETEAPGLRPASPICLWWPSPVPAWGLPALHEAPLQGPGGLWQGLGKAGHRGGDWTPGRASGPRAVGPEKVTGQAGSPGSFRGKGSPCWGAREHRG